MRRHLTSGAPVPYYPPLGRVDLERIFLQESYGPLLIIHVVLGLHPERDAVEDVRTLVGHHMPAGGRQRHDTALACLHVQHADVACLSRPRALRAVHGAVTEITPGMRELHRMRQFHPMGTQALRLFQPVEREAVEVCANRGDEFLVREPHQVGAALEGGWCRFEAQRGDAGYLIQRLRIVEQEMLPSAAQEPNGARRVDRRRVATCYPVVVSNLVRVPICHRIEQEQAYASHSFEAVDSVAIQRDVKSERIATNLEGHDAPPTTARPDNASLVAPSRTR